MSSDSLYEIVKPGCMRLTRKIGLQHTNLAKKHLASRGVWFTVKYYFVEDQNKIVEKDESNGT